MKLKMEDLPRSIRKEIRKANILSNKLRRKMGLKDAKSQCTEDTFTEIEVKCSFEDFKAGKIPDIKNAKEYAYFYDRDDGYFGAEKIKDGKLKEFYEVCLPYGRIAYNNINYINLQIGTIQELLLEIENMIKNGYNSFCINGVKYYMNYYSINPQNLSKEYLYIYPLNADNYTKDLNIFYMFENFFEYKKLIFDNLEGIYFPIFRYSFIKNRIDLVYLENFCSGSIFFYYFDIKNKKSLSLKEMLIESNTI